MSFEETIKKNIKKIPKHMRDTESCRDALRLIYNTGYETAKKQAGDVVLMFACSDYPRCDHDWCRQMQDISDAINQMQP